MEPKEVLRRLRRIHDRLKVKLAVNAADGIDMFNDWNSDENKYVNAVFVAKLAFEVQALEITIQAYEDLYGS